MNGYDGTNISTTRSMYERYVSHNNGSSSANKGMFEQTISFRAGLSSYHMNNRSIEAGAMCKWDKANCGGAPMDYGPVAETLYVDGSDSHTLVIGSTGSKKSRLVVMPTIRILAAARENMIVCDPKGEVFQRTAGFLRDCGYQIHAINLREPKKGDCWNMLSIPYTLYCAGEIDKACEFVNDMTINLIPIVARDPYWDYSSRDVLFGLVLLLFKICKETGLGEQAASMRGLLRLREELFCSSDSDVVQATGIWKYAKEDDVIRARLHGTVICPEKTLACILSTFDQHMSCFSLQPHVTDMLSTSTFDMNEIGFSCNAIFLIMPDEKTTFHKIVAIFLKQMYELLIDAAFKRTAGGRFPSRVNFVLDEFSSLPTISDFPQMVAASRSRNIRFFLVVQSKHQLRQRYEEETDTIMSNCANWMLLTSRELELLREVSELCGVTGLNREPLVSVYRLQRLNKDSGECLIMCGRKNPYIAKLPDIDDYDGGQAPQYELPVRIHIETQALSHHVFEQAVADYISAREVASNDSQQSVLKENDWAEEPLVNDADLQKRLEAKFDELFGCSPSDDDESDSL